MNEIKLKTCPFCGGEATIIQTSNCFYISCNSCNAIMGRTNKSASALRGKLSFDTKEEAIKAWNTRKPLERVFERLEEVGDIKFSKFSLPLITVRDAIRIIKEEVN